MHRRLPTWLLFVFLSLPAQAQINEIRPVDFQLQGVIDQSGGGGLERVHVTVRRASDQTLLASRTFTDGTGGYSMAFSAAVEVTLGLGDDDDEVQENTAPRTGVSWMGAIWPNPVPAGGDIHLTLPYAAPEGETAAPELEMFDLRGRRLDLDETLASGIYLYRLRFGRRVAPARKLTVLGRGRPQVHLVRASSNPLGVDGEPSEPTKKLDGVVEVVVRVEKAGFVAQERVMMLDSTQSNLASFSLDAEASPSAGLSVGGTLRVGEAVLFDGSTSIAADGQALDYAWVFGDGQRGGGQHVAHVYATPGDYTVELTVAGTHGALATATTAITVVAGPPAASNGATMVGSITDAVGNLLEGVLVTHLESGINATSLADGSVTLSGLPTGVPAVLQLTRADHTLQTVRVELPDNNDFSYFETAMRRRREAVALSKVEDGSFTVGEDGACVDLPPDALVKADGSLAQGPATLCLTPVDVSDRTEVAAFPGSFLGVTPTGDRGPLLTYGVMEVVFEQDGEKLQLAPGRCADVDIPIYTGGATLGAEIDLWSVDPSTGLWRQEGSGVVVASNGSPTGLALRAQVTHFSWWNCDAFDRNPYRPKPRCTDVPPGESCYFDSSIDGDGSNGPSSGPSGWIPAQGGMEVLMPSDVTMTCTGAAANGTLRGSVTVFTEPGTEGAELLIPLFPIDAGGGELVLPASVEASIELLSEVDVYTLEASAGQVLSLVGTTAPGSSLEGTITLIGPDDQVVRAASFTPSEFVAWALELPLHGEYRVEVTGTQEVPGAYTLSMQFVENYDMQVPSRVSDQLSPFHVQPFKLRGEVGTWTSVDFRRTSDGPYGADLRIVAADGTVVYHRGISGGSQSTLPFQLGSAQPYSIELVSTGFAGDYELVVHDVPELLPGEVVSGEASYGETRYYRFESEAGDFYRAILDESEGFIGQVNILDLEGGTHEYRMPQTIFEGTHVVEMGNSGTQLIWTHANGNSGPDAPRPYRVALDLVRPPVQLNFDAAGRDLRVPELDHLGDTRLYRFDGEAGAGVLIQMRSTAGSTMTEKGHFRLFRVDTRTPRTAQVEVSGADTHSRYWGDVAVNVLQYDYFRLPADDIYVLAVSAATPDDGLFELVVDYVSPGEAVVVDDDLQDAPGATTRSLQAAMVAVEAGGTVTVHPGDYWAPHSFLALEAITLQGTDRDAVFLRTSFVYPVVDFENGLVALRDLTVQTESSTSHTGVEVYRGDHGVIEGIRTMAAPGTGTMGAGIELVACTFMEVRNCRFDDGLRSVFLNGTDDSIVRDSVMNGPTTLVQLTGSNRDQILDNQFTVSESYTAVNSFNCAGIVVEGNDILVDAVDGQFSLNQSAVVLQDRDLQNDQPPSVVRGNTIRTNRGGVEVRLSQEGSGILIEQNHIVCTREIGWELVSVKPDWTEPGKTVVVRNNVFDGARSSSALRFYDCDSFESVELVNNTIRIHPDADIVETQPMVWFDGPHQTLELLPVVAVNNILVGGGGIGISSNDQTFITADYNLFSGFNASYGGGASGGPNDVTDAPGFIDEMLRVGAGSPAVDTGATAGEFPAVPGIDYSGAVRPMGSGVDRGAHER